MALQWLRTTATKRFNLFARLFIVDRPVIAFDEGLFHILSEGHDQIKIVINAMTSPSMANSIN